MNENQRYSITPMPKEMVSAIVSTDFIVAKTSLQSMGFSFLKYHCQYYEGKSRLFNGCTFQSGLNSNGEYTVEDGWDG